MKTAFLMALATGRRVSELHALRKTDLVITDEKVVFAVAEGFISKTQKPGDTPLVIEMIANSGNEALCPVKCLKQYLVMTEKLRPDRHQLFVSFCTPHKEISKDTLSRWLASVIRDSYKVLHDCLLPHVNAHEIRAVAASMFVRGNTIDDILSTGLWKSKFCFLNHYFRDVVDWNLSDCGSIVVANKLVR
jgi:integrase